MCTGNTIKPAPGDAVSCNISCDVSTNAKHTKCGKFVLHKPFKLYLQAVDAVPSGLKYEILLFSLEIILH